MYTPPRVIQEMFASYEFFRRVGFPADSVSFLTTEQKLPPGFSPLNKSLRKGKYSVFAVVKQGILDFKLMLGLTDLKTSDVFNTWTERWRQEQVKLRPLEQYFVFRNRMKVLTAMAIKGFTIPMKEFDEFWKAAPKDVKGAIAREILDGAPGTH